jgi:hypothetical protein
LVWRHSDDVGKTQRDDYGEREKQHVDVGKTQRDKRVVLAF